MDCHVPAPAQPMRPTSERPVYRLSVELLATYKQINELFYEAKRKRQAMEKSGDPKGIHNFGYDDDSGNYIVQIGEEIAGRYIVEELLGKGSFGIVVKAHDHRRDECVAVKIIKNKVQFFHQAKVEMEILTKLNAAASEEHNIVKLKKIFTWKEHLCLVFELLSFNLYDLLKYTKFHGVSLNLIRKFACQILKTLEFLASPPIRVIHCDLKPENILLKNPKRSGVKVIDFGSSCFLNRKMFKYIQSRFYRSPEVIWGLNYDCAIDMWSLACILVEMHTGLPLFDGKNEAEQLLKFHEVMGPPPAALVDSSPKRAKLYTYTNNKTPVLTQCKGVPPTQKTSLEKILGVATGGPNGRRKGQQGHTEQDYANFVDLITKMLQYNPKQRLTPTEALHHPFLVLPEEAPATGGGTSPVASTAIPASDVAVSSTAAVPPSPTAPHGWSPAPPAGPAPAFPNPPPHPAALPFDPSTFSGPLPPAADAPGALPLLPTTPAPYSLLGMGPLGQPDPSLLPNMPLLSTMQSVQQLWQQAQVAMPAMGPMSQMQQMQLMNQQYFALLAQAQAQQQLQQQLQQQQLQQQLQQMAPRAAPSPALPSKPPSSHSSSSSGPNAGAAPMHRQGAEKASRSHSAGKRQGESASPAGQEQAVT